MKKYVQIPTINLSIDTGADSHEADLLISLIAIEKFALAKLQLASEHLAELQKEALLTEIARREQFIKQLLSTLEQLSL